MQHSSSRMIRSRHGSAFRAARSLIFCFDVYCRSGLHQRDRSEPVLRREWYAISVCCGTRVLWAWTPSNHMVRSRSSSSAPSVSSWTRRRTEVELIDCSLQLDSLLESEWRALENCELIYRIESSSRI
jgi:hypothetical protein